jgi:HAD superfamily hydrolase (TIGR01509 family)
MDLRALIFDVDGTLADTEDMHRRAFNAAFAQQGLTWQWGRRVYLHLLATTGGKERIAHFVDRLKLPGHEKTQLSNLIPAIHKAKTARYAELIASEASLRPGISELLDEANRAGVRLAIASTTTRANIDALLETALGKDAVSRFDLVATGDVVERKKPAPDIYLYTLDLLDLPARACMAFEDSDVGLRAAKSAGLFTVVTPTEWTRGNDFGSADVILRDVSEAGGLNFFRDAHSVWRARRAEAA